MTASTIANPDALGPAHPSSAWPRRSHHPYSVWPRKTRFIGYARATDEQPPALQLDALRAAGCAVIQHSSWPRKSHLVGYACRSTDEHTLAMQIDALRAAGCAVIHWDTRLRSRRGFKFALADLKFGDTLVVWKLDRVGRSLPFVSDFLRKHCIGLRSLAEHIDTGARGGQIRLDSFLVATAEFQRRAISERTRRRTSAERRTISERTIAGMQAAKQRGTHVGRPSSLAGAGIELARRLLDEGKSQAEVARIMRVSRTTIHRVIAA